MTELLKADVNLVPKSDPRYSCCSVDSTYGGIDQKWIIVSSEEMKAREEKTFDKNLEKRYKGVLKGLKEVTKILYECEADARNALLRYLNKNPLVTLTESDVEIVHKRANGKRGRPKEGEVLLAKYQIRASVKLNQQTIDKERAYLGRFILATNVLDLDAEAVLNHYKGQMLVEQGFRFLKDKSFRVAEVYLKNERRIEALCMIMVLCLMIYAYTEWLMRKRLQEEETSVLNQKKKLTQNPTLKWIFFKLREIKSCILVFNDKLCSSVQRLNSELIKIRNLLGLPIPDPPQQMRTNLYKR